MISAVARSLLGGFTRAASGGVESPDTAAGDSAASDRPPRSRSRSPALASMNSGDSNLSAAAARADGADSADGEPKARKRFSLPRKFAVRLPSKGRRRAGTADVVSTPPAVDVDDPGTPTRGRSASAVAASVVVGGGVGADGTTDGEGGGIDSAAPAPSDGDSGGANRKRSQSKTQRFMRYEGYDVPPRWLGCALALEMTFAFARVPCDRLFGNSYLRTRVPRSAEKLKWGNETALLDNQCDDIVFAFEERKHELMSPARAVVAREAAAVSASPRRRANDWLQRVKRTLRKPGAVVGGSGASDANRATAGDQAKGGGAKAKAVAVALPRLGLCYDDSSHVVTWVKPNPSAAAFACYRMCVGWALRLCCVWRCGSRV